MGEAKAKQSWHHDKRKTGDRGYGWEWQKLRLAILKRDQYRCQCDDCKRDARLTPATQVDHIVSKAAWLKAHGNLNKVDNALNLQSLSGPCHERKTAREQGRTVRAGCAADGMPSDPGHPWNTSA